MLILTRNPKQAVNIGDDVVVIGVCAPKEIAVHREEIYNKIKAQGAEA